LIPAAQTGSTQPVAQLTKPVPDQPATQVAAMDAWIDRQIEALLSTWPRLYVFVDLL